jgi:hypothetical protein
MTVVAGTGSRSLARESSLARLETARAIRGKLEELGATSVLSGGAEGWDECLASAALDLQIPYTLVLPYDGYLEHYWSAAHSQSGIDRLRGAQSMKDFASEIVYVCPSRTAIDQHTYKPTNANLVRNCLMIQKSNHVLVYDTGSRGTAHGLSECYKHRVPYSLWANGVWMGPSPLRHVTFLRSNMPRSLDKTS